MFNQIHILSELEKFFGNLFGDNKWCTEKFSFETIINKVKKARNDTSNNFVPKEGDIDKLWHKYNRKGATTPNGITVTVQLWQIKK